MVFVWQNVIVDLIVSVFDDNVGWLYVVSCYCVSIILTCIIVVIISTLLLLLLLYFNFIFHYFYFVL